MNILITGGCGFIGSRLAIYLKKKITDSNILSIDNLTKKYSLFNEKLLKREQIKNLRIDLGNYEAFKKIKFKSDIIIDCSADPAVENSKNKINRVFKSNLVSTLNILYKSIKDKSFLIFLSTSRVYPIKTSYEKFEIYKKTKKVNLYDENTKTEGAKTIYGFTKLASEMLIKEFNFLNNVKYLINRCGLITGVGQYGKVEQGLVSLWLWRHINNNNLTYQGYNGSGQQIRDILDVDDLCQLIFQQIKKRKKIYNQTFCVGGGNTNFVSLKKLTFLCNLITKNKVKILKKEKTSLYDIPYYVTSNKKIKSFYNWKPKTSIFNSLNKMNIWMGNNKFLIKKYF